jgi:putative membrane protein
MPSEQRLHPVSILFAFAGSLKAFAIPGLLVLLFGRTSSGGPDGGTWELWMMLLLIPAALAAVARYLSFRVRYESADLIVRSGILFRNERHIPYSRIQNLEAVRNVFHRAFGVVEVRVENASGKEAEATISVLPLSAFDEMRRRVFDGRDRSGAGTDAAAAARTGGDAGPAAQPLLRLPLRDLLLFGFIENRGLIVVGTIYGLLWEFGPLAGFWSRLFDESRLGSGVVRDTVRTIAAGNLPPLDRIGVVLAGLAGFLVAVRLLSMAWAAIRLYDFRLSRTGDDLRTEFGLFTRISTTIPVRRIQTITIREGPLHRWLKRVTVRVETAGGQVGQPGGVADREWLAPLVPQADLPRIVQTVLPEFDFAAAPWQPVDPAAFRRAVKPAAVFAVAIPAACAVAIGWWALALLPASLAWMVFATRRHVEHLAWAATGDVVAFRSGWLWRVATAARVAKIQAVAMRESPFDRRWGMARFRVDTAGASERSVRVDVPYLPRQTAGDLYQQLAARAARTDFRW